MAKVKVKVRDLSLRGETVHTRWGFVTFDRDGTSDLELDEAEVPMLRDIKPYPWIADAPEESSAGSDVAPASTSSPEASFDQSDVTPPQGNKKRRGA